jgi:hypothetical protein
MRGTRLAPVLGIALTALVGGVWLLCAGPSPGSSPAWTPAEGVLTPADRDALSSAPVTAGEAPTGPDPSLDLSDPRAVVTAYVTAGYSVRDTDVGRTNRRASGYAAPNTPPSTIGVLVLDPPPPGHTNTAFVTDVTQVSGEPTGTRRGYLVGYRYGPQPPSVTVASDRRTRYLLVVRQFDGRWLVAGDAAAAQVGEP